LAAYFEIMAYFAAFLPKCAVPWPGVYLLKLVTWHGNMPNTAYGPIREKTYRAMSPIGKVLSQRKENR
jgi:hypothetical protein